MPKLIIEIETDPVPGWGYNVEDFVEYFKSQASGIQHYIKSVEVLPELPDVQAETGRGETFNTEPYNKLVRHLRKNNVVGEFDPNPY